MVILVKSQRAAQRVPLLREGGSHQENVVISHDVCNNQRYAKGLVIAAPSQPGWVRTDLEQTNGD